MNEFLSLYLFVESQICKFLLILFLAQYAEHPDKIKPRMANSVGQ